MNSFLTKLLLFLSPVLLLGIVVTYVLTAFGEFTNVDELLELHASERPYLWAKRYVPFERDPKYEILKASTPAITTFGNSRVLQIRAGFFSSTTTFYNYGEINSVGKLKETLERFRADRVPYPDLIIVALEQSYFIDHSAGVNVSDDGIGTPQWLLIYSTVLKDIVRGKVRVGDVPAHRDDSIIGTEANVLGSGYREDGSRQYSELFLDHTYPEHEDYRFEDTKRRIGEGINLFAHANRYNPERLREYTEFLDLAQELSIRIVAFFPPYAPTAYALMQEPQYEFGYQKALAQDVATVTSSHGFSFKDFSDPESLSLSDSDFFDGYHPKEHVLGNILTELSKGDATLHRYIRK